MVMNMKSGKAIIWEKQKGGSEREAI